jgi:ADP-ribose pyrophosphatase YjhB (NUDIX family)/AcrR family transcriptional regulator
VADNTAPDHGRRADQQHYRRGDLGRGDPTRRDDRRRDGGQHDDGRRAELVDAALRVLAREGGGGLTHRAVDEEAGVPTGTAARYLPGRPALVDAVAERVAARLAPEVTPLERRPPAVAERLAPGVAALEPRPPAAAVPSRVVFAAHLRHLVRRLTDDRDLLTALFELRLEAARRPEAPTVRLWNADPAEIALRHAVDGLLLAHLTEPEPDPPSDHLIDALVAALLPTEPPITRPRAVAYVVRDGDVLVFNHRPSATTETAGLQVPGGTVHDGEDPAAAVVREVREETGLEVEVVRPLGTVTRGGRALHHFHVVALGPTPEAWDHDEMSDGDVRLWTFSLFWLPIPVARHALDHGMGDLLDRL